MSDRENPLQQDFSWHCYGCGKCNEKGLQAETIKTKDGYLCEWHTREEHTAHPGKYHHGLLTTICFCHGAWSATSESYDAEGKEISNPLDYFYVNKSITYEILKPIKLNSTASILANVTLGSNGSAKVDFQVKVENEVCAKAKSKLIRVYADEMEF